MMNVDDVRELVQARLDDERAVRKYRHLELWSDGYMLALSRILEDIDNFENEEDD